MKRIWKNAVCVLLCLALVLPLCGCGGRELYERLLIHGIGVDLEEDGFTVTVRSSTSPEKDGEELFTCTGSSVLEAMNSLTLSTGRKPFYAHNYLVVFGRECARQGLDSCLDFFVRYYNTRPAVQVYLAENTAEEVLSSESEGKDIKMSELQQLGKSAKENSSAVSVDLLEFVNGALREGGSPVMPVLRAGERGVEITSTAYFDRFRLAGFLTPEETRGYLAAVRGLNSGEAIIRGEHNETVTLSFSSGLGAIRLLTGSGGPPRFLVETEVTADVSAVDCGQPAEKSLYAWAEQEVSRLLTEEIRAAFEKTALEQSCDIFGLGSLLYRQDPAYWRQNAHAWKELLPSCGLEIQVTAKVRRMEQEKGTGSWLTYPGIFAPFAAVFACGGRTRSE